MSLGSGVYVMKFIFIIIQWGINRFLMIKVLMFFYKSQLRNK